MGAAKVVNGKIAIDPAVCNNCGRCAANCPFGAFGEGAVGYQVYIGGRWGKKFSRGLPLSKIITDEDELLQVVEKAILLFREQGKAGERFADTIARIGFENAEQMLLSDELLARKDQILQD